MKIIDTSLFFNNIYNYKKPSDGTYMKKLLLISFCLLLSVTMVQNSIAQANPKTYLNDIKAELADTWPENRTINLVFHGHSVPTGYFRTPEVHKLEAYPSLLLGQLKAVYPNAVINIITTSIGGENSVQGSKRFKRDVLTHKPDVLFIDYALNDRSIGLAASERAMKKMIKVAIRKRIKVILLTPSPDLTENILDTDAPLNRFAEELRSLAERYHVGLADSYGAFYRLAKTGKDIRKYMAQSNHPNRPGHEVITNEIMSFFK